MYLSYMDPTQKTNTQINPSEIKKEVAEYIIIQLKHTAQDTRHKFTYIKGKQPL